MELEFVTYHQVIDGYQPTGDDYGLATYALLEPRKKAFLSNPNLKDTSRKMINLVRHEGKIIGRSMSFPTKLKVGDDYINIVGGSALEVASEYQTGDAGTLLLSSGLTKKENNAYLSSGFSRIGAQCQKAMRSYILTFPQLIQIRHFTKILPAIGIPIWLAQAMGWVGSFLYAPFRLYIYYKAARLKKKYSVNRVLKVPDWVDEIVLKDGHKYMEVHDHKWLQWNLDNMFHSHEQNINAFYTVSQDGENIGFFMTKERHGSIEVRGIKDALFGSIVEWGSKDVSRLSEYDLYLIALSSFSKEVDLVYMATTDYSLVKKIKYLGIIQWGDAIVALKDLRKQWKDAKDSSLWRLRLGYSDSILN